MLDTKTNFVDEKVEIDPKDLQVSFDNNTTETKDEKTKDDSKIVKVSLGNDAEALAEEKSKPKEKQDKNKIKQLEKSIKNREKEIKDQVKNNKKYKPGENAWNGVIDDKNTDDWSYIVNNWDYIDIPNRGDFIENAANTINKDIKNIDKDREYWLNLVQRGFEEWNGMQENPDDPNNYDKWKEEAQNNKPAKDGEQTFTKEKAWEIYNSPTGTARGLFENFKTLNMDAEEAKKEFLSKNPNPSETAKNAFRNVYKSELVESKVTENKETQPGQNLKVGGQTPRKVLNEAQSETSKNIKDVILDETYQTLTDDEKRDALKKATEKALNKYSSSFIDKANTRENAAQLSKFLPRFAIQHFLEGDFGNKKDPKSWGTLGYFLLDKVGKSLVNASQVARGFSPTEKTALENYNETMMKNAFGRDDENRKKILNSSLDTLVKDSDVLREVGISDFKIFDDFTEKVLTQYQDNIQNVNLDKILKEKSDFILNMPSEEQQKFIGYLIAMDVSEPGSAAYLNAAYRAADMEQRFAKTDAEKYAAQKSKTEINLKLAGMEVNNKTLFAQLDSIELKNEKDRATMAAEIDRVVRENEKLIEEIKKARTENSYLAKEKEKELEQKVANIVSTYANVGTNIVNTVSKIIEAIIPG